MSCPEQPVRKLIRGCPKQHVSCWSQVLEKTWEEMISFYDEIGSLSISSIHTGRHGLADNRSLRFKGCNEIVIEWRAEGRMKQVGVLESISI